MSMPPDWVLEQYRCAACSVVVGMAGNPHQYVELPGGRAGSLWMLEAAKLHELRLRLDALRAAGLA
jgi:hypothetical protein